jgi:hypothetical protein
VFAGSGQRCERLILCESIAEFRKSTREPLRDNRGTMNPNFGAMRDQKAHCRAKPIGANLRTLAPQWEQPYPVKRLLI